MLSTRGPFASATKSVTAFDVVGPLPGFVTVIGSCPAVAMSEAKTVVVTLWLLTKVVVCVTPLTFTTAPL